jgi:hypothetical protein
MDRLSVPQPFRAGAAWWVLAAIGAASAVVGFPGLTAALLAVGFGAVAGYKTAGAAWRRAKLRHDADSLLRVGVRVHPDSALLTWRSAELTAPRQRRMLARSLTSLIEEVDRPTPLPALPVNRKALRRHAALAAAVASRLARLERPVGPRGIVLVSDLLTNVFASPLFGRKDERQVREALESSLDALDRL